MNLHAPLFCRSAYARILLITVAAGLAPACTFSPVQEDALSAQTPPPCRSPEHLVRDLTVPWGARSYIIGPCPLSPAVIKGPATPGSSGIEGSTSEKAMP